MCFKDYINISQMFSFNPYNKTMYYQFNFTNEESYAKRYWKT